MLPLSHSGTVDVQPCLVFLDLAGLRISLTPHLPDCGQNRLSGRYLGFVNDGQVTVFELIRNFFIHACFEFLPISLTHSLVIVERVWVRHRLVGEY